MSGEVTVEDGNRVEQYLANVEEIRKSMSAVRGVVKALHERVSAGELDTEEGISLLSAKNRVMLQYLQSLVLLSAHNMLGHSQTEHERPEQPFSSTSRDPRGSGAGDRVDALVEGRVVLEKIKSMEGKMKYQIDKLVRLSKDTSSNAAENDPLAFKPNPEALMQQENGDEDGGNDSDGDAQDRGAVYRPPKLAPMPYTEPQKSKDKRRGPLPTALSSLAQMDLSMPHTESTSGLGSTPALMSNRAKELHRMTEFEEDNMTRLVMKKKDAKRRRQDEADIALGGVGGSMGRRGRSGGLEDEFGDILRSVGRSRTGVVGDGYEELRQKGRKASALSRSRDKSHDDAEDVAEDGPRLRKRSRFEKAVKSTKRRSNLKRRI